jgi:hypothetical protein
MDEHKAESLDGWRAYLAEGKDRAGTNVAIAVPQRLTEGLYGPDVTDLPQGT